MDSIVALFKKAKPDTSRVNQFAAICAILNRSNMPDDLLQHASEVLSISEKENYKRGIGISKYAIGIHQFANRNYEEALNTLSQSREILAFCGDKINAGRSIYVSANIQYDLGNYVESVKNCNAALQIWQDAGFTQLNGACYNDMALSYGRMGDYSKGVESAYKALKACSETADKKEMGQALHVIGMIFYEFHNPEIALKNFKGASLIYQELGDKFGFARNNNMVGEILLDQGNYQAALQKFKESLSIYSEKDAPAWGRPWGYSNIGSVYEKQADSAIEKGDQLTGLNKYKDALKNYQLSLEQFEAIKDPAGSMEQYVLIGVVNFKLGEFSAAKTNLLRGLEMAAKAGSKQNLADGYLYLSKIDSAAGNSAKAYQYYKMHVLYRDSLFNMESSQNLSLQKTQLEFEKKDNEIALLASENKLKTTLAEKQSLQKKLAYGLIALVTLLGLLGFRRYRKTARQKAEQNRLQERLAISQDLHDHIGSTLSSIAVYSKVAQIQGDKGQKEELNNLLGRIRSASANMVTEMNDIVWSINPLNDSIEKIVDRMENYARPLLLAANISFDFSCAEPVKKISLNMTSCKNFFLVFKEAINNTIKYAEATKLKASIEIIKGELRLTILDNGVGFNRESADQKANMGGNGLLNMQLRTQAMKGKLSIESSPGNGCSVILSVPI